MQEDPITKPFIASARIINAKLVKVFFLYQTRNEWLNWQGDTQNRRRPTGGLSFSIDAAMARAENCRGPGTSLIIEDSVAIAIECETGSMVLFEYFSDVPFRSLQSAFKSKANQVFLRNLLDALPKGKFFRNQFFIGAPAPVYEDAVDGHQYFKRAASPGGTKNSLAWSAKPYLPDIRPAKQICSIIRESVTTALKEDNAGPATTSAVSEPTRMNASLKEDLSLVNTSSDAPQTLEAENVALAAIQVPVSLSATEREQLTLARVGQGLYRKRLEEIESRCRLTALAVTNHLIASHIKPWCDCKDVEKLDGNNGLLLSPHIDHLFDKGFISFTESGELLISKELSHDVLVAWRIDAVQNVGEFNKIQMEYLAYHRQHIFRN